MTERVTRIALLTHPAGVPFLTWVLQKHNPALEVIAVHDPAALAEACAVAGTRLIAVCTNVIVPASILDSLSGPAYKFHPGPPTRPGSHASVFAIYDGDTRFGVTAHEITQKADSGPIVAVEWFQVARATKRTALETLAYLCIVDMYSRLAPHLASNPAPLPRIDAAWCGASTTLAQAQALGRLAPGIPADEIARRRRACGALMVEKEVRVEDPDSIEEGDP
jgi:methionyl-tRNA formyltransferase